MFHPSSTFSSHINSKWEETGGIAMHPGNLNGRQSFGFFSSVKSVLRNYGHGRQNKARQGRKSKVTAGEKKAFCIKKLEDRLIFQQNEWKVGINKEDVEEAWEGMKKTYVSDCHRNVLSYAHGKHEKELLM